VDHAFRARYLCLPDHRPIHRDDPQRGVETMTSAWIILGLLAVCAGFVVVVAVQALAGLYGLMMAVISDDE
jgi:hypothetical protein